MRQRRRGDERRPYKPGFDLNLIPVLSPDEITLMDFKPKGGTRAHGQRIKDERGIDPDGGCVYCHRPRAKAKTLDELLAPPKN